MKTAIVILIMTVLVGAALLIAGAVKSPDRHLAPTEQPVHKLPSSTPPAAGAP